MSEDLCVCVSCFGCWPNEKPVIRVFYTSMLIRFSWESKFIGTSMIRHGRIRGHRRPAFAARTTSGTKFATLRKERKSPVADRRRRAHVGEAGSSDQRAGTVRPTVRRSIRHPNNNFLRVSLRSMRVGNAYAYARTYVRNIWAGKPRSAEHVVHIGSWCSVRA